MWSELFEKIKYEKEEIRSIFRKFEVIDRFKIDTSLYQLHPIQDGETPESISFKYYKTTEYWNIILLLNDIFDAHYEWPLPYNTLITYVSKWVDEVVDDINDDVIDYLLVNIPDKTSWSSLNTNDKNIYIDYVKDLLKYGYFSDLTELSVNDFDTFIDDTVNVIITVLYEPENYNPPIAINTIDKRRDFLINELKTGIVKQYCTDNMTTRNEKNREIKILRPEYIQDLKDQLEREFMG